MKSKIALICGVSGQDGAYLSNFLLEKGYIVYGSSRDINSTSFRNLYILGIFNRIKLISLDSSNYTEIRHLLLQIKPDEIYNLAGQSSVGLSFEQPIETMQSIGMGTLNLLEAIRHSEQPIRLFNAGSSECFGDTGENPADEATPFNPRNPYGVAKATAFWEVAIYRDAYNIFACTGILFNHESPLRSDKFVTSKIISAACKIAKGGREKLILGNTGISRDWGWAPEYVEAMWKMLQQPTPKDYVIATGITSELKDFVRITFECVGLNWENHVESNAHFFRPTDQNIVRANPTKINKELKWAATFTIEQIIAKMVSNELNKFQ